MAFDSSGALTAKAELAERLTTIGALYLPAGWTATYRKSLSGRCYMREQRIEAPAPRTRKSLYIWLHECGHANLHFVGSKKRPRYVEEYEAEQFAHAKMREHGIPVPRDMTVRAKAYVRRKLGQAQARGATAAKLPKHITAWANS